jgi:hypothetical protein
MLNPDYAALNDRLNRYSRAFFEVSTNKSVYAPSEIVNVSGTVTESIIMGRYYNRGSGITSPIITTDYTEYTDLYIKIDGSYKSLKGYPAGYGYDGTYYPAVEGFKSFVAPSTPGTYALEFYGSGLHNSVTHTIYYTVAAPAVPAPTIDSVTINTTPVKPDGTTQYTITSTASDSTGGNAVTEEYTLINFDGTTAAYDGIANQGMNRGYLGWSKNNIFPWWSGNYKSPSINCSGGGHAAIYGGGYGPEYINLHSCSTSVSENTRTVSYVVSFNSNFTIPTENNTLSGFANNSTTSKYDGWSPFNTFNLTCTDSVPSGSTMCLGDDSGFSTTAPISNWTYKGANDSSCTAAKCEYYTPVITKCGSANNAMTAPAPSSNLCEIGYAASSVAETTTTYNWTCAGESCSANRICLCNHASEYCPDELYRNSCGAENVCSDGTKDCSSSTRRPWREVSPN